MPSRNRFDPRSAGGLGRFHYRPARRPFRGGASMTAVISPSRIARFFYHECERYLRFSSVPANERSAYGIPSGDRDHAASSAAVVEAGFRWEEKVVGELLSGRVILGAEEVRLRDRVLS